MEYNETEYMRETLEEWVMNKCDQWRDNYDDNYRELHEEYYRLWRGRWAKEDSLRQSERSRIITPALQQAVESSVAEVEEATFGRGRWFDIQDDFQDADGSSADIEFTKKQLWEDMQYARVRSGISEVLLNAAIFGTGIGEIYLSEEKEYVPASQPTSELGVEAVGVMERDRFLVKIRPIMPKHFLIDPLASSIEDALGCAIDRYVPIHQVHRDIESGIYRDVDVDTVPTDTELEADEDLTYDNNSAVRLTRYYGLVPRALFNDAINEVDEDEKAENELTEALTNEEGDSEEGYVEAIVVIANGNTLLKVEENPFMMQDRPIVAFSWDTVPSVFWGRGVCEKGYNAQKALDTEMRARIDALALTVHPMMAVDASRIPRGAKFEIRPGKTLLTTGNPAEILQPFNFGKVDQITFAQGAKLQEMVQQATGAVDTVSFSNAMQGDGTAAGISMSMGAIIKRHKRTLLNFQENFLLPLISKTAHRYIQFEPNLYKARDYKFVPVSSLGIIAREYEVTQLVQLLQTMPQDTPMYSYLVQSIIENMNLTNREEIINGMKQAMQPDPAQQEAAQAQQQMQMQALQLTLEKTQAEIAEIMTRVEQNQVETQLLPIEEETRRIQALAKNVPLDDFERFVKLAELELEKQKIDIKEADSISNERIAMMQMSNANRG